MNTRGNERLREMLSAEYALGTLRGGARRRFERWLRSDAELQALSVAWSERLAPLIDAVSPLDPPARVWEAIEARLPGFSRERRAAMVPLAWWDRLGLWRGLAGAFAVVAAFALAVAWRPAPVPQTQFVEVQTLPAAVATITDPKSGAPVAVVMASKGDDVLLVEVAADVKVGSGQVLQLWTASKRTGALVSMGLLPPALPGAPIRLSSVDAAKLADAKAFGLSLEPAGGSPQPTHVLGLGPLVRLSS